MCGLHAHEKNKSTNATQFGGGRPQPKYSTINHLVYLCVSINFIEIWINDLSNNFTWHCYAYQDKMKEVLKNSY